MLKLRSLENLKRQPNKALDSDSQAVVPVLQVLVLLPEDKANEHNEIKTGRKQSTSGLFYMDTPCIMSYN